MSLRRTPTLLLAGALALGLAACDAGGGEPTTKPTTSTSTTSPPAETSSASSEEPSTPAVAAPNPAAYPGMDQQTEEGAKQAYRYFWALTVYAYATGDIEPLHGVTTDSCTYCSDLAQDVQDIHAKGGGWSTASVSDLLLESRRDNAETVSVNYGFIITEHGERDSKDGPEDIKPDTSYASGAQMTWAEGAWKVNGIDVETAG